MPLKASITATSSSPKETEEAIHAITLQIDSLTTQLTSYQTIQDSRHDAMQSILHTLLERVATITQPLPNFSTTPPYTQPIMFNTTFPDPFLQPQPHFPIFLPLIRLPKLQLQPFDGQDPMDWLFQADQFFLFYQVPVEQRLSMAVFYMKGEALSWYKWMYHNHQLVDWHSFTRALELRFGPSSY